MILFLGYQLVPLLKNLSSFSAILEEIGIVGTFFYSVFYIKWSSIIIKECDSVFILFLFFLILSVNIFEFSWFSMGAGSFSWIWLGLSSSSIFKSSVYNKNNFK